MIIRTALTGDLHTNVARRSEEARRIAYWIVDDAVARGAHFFGIGGDGIDGPMTEKDRAWLIEFSDYCGNRLPTFWLMGNHEPALSLRCLRGRTTKYPVIVEEGAGVHVIDTEGGPLAVAAVSFPVKAQLLAAIGRPVSGEEVDEITGKALQDIFRGLGVKVRDLGLPTIGLIHGTIKGSKISDDQPDRPLGLDIDIADLSLINCDFVCAPHIHKANEFSWNGRVLAATPTSPLYCDYGEATQEKGYLLAEFDTGIVHVEPGDWVKWQRVPTPAVPMILVEGQWVEDNGIGHIRIAANDPEDVAKMLIPGGPLTGADVRFRFHFPSDQRAAAKNHADLWAEVARQAGGALKVTLDPIQIPTTKSRIPELATTVRLEDKIRLYWKAIGFEPSTERERALMEMLHELQDDPRVHEFGMAAGRTAPTLRKVRLAGFMKFRDEISLNLDEIEGPLTAIVAPNECGKSLLVQLMGPGALFGETPNRGTLDDLSIATDSFINVEFDMAGARYDLTQVANGKSRTGHVSLLKNGQPELSKAGRKEYKEWRVKNLLPTSMYDALICQSGTEKFIDMQDGPRVELLLRVLGLEVYEILAEMARKRASAIAEELAGGRQRIEEIGDVLIPELQLAVDTVVVDLAVMRSDAEFAGANLSNAKSAAVVVEVQRTEYTALVTHQKELVEKERALASLMGELKTRLEVQQELMGEKNEIDKAVLELDLLTNEIASRQQAKQVLDLEHSTAQGVLNGLRDNERVLSGLIAEKEGQGRSLQDRLSATDSALETCRATLQDADAIRAAVNETGTHTAAWDAKRDEIAVQRTREAELAGLLAEVRARVNGNAQRAAELIRKRDSLKTTVANKDRVVEATERVDRIKRDLQTVEVEAGRYREDILHLQREISGSKDSRITGLRQEHLDNTKDNDPDPWTRSQNMAARSQRAIDTDDDSEAAFEDNPARLATARKEMTERETVLTSLRQELLTCDRIASALPVIEEAEKQLVEILAELETSETLYRSLIEESNGVIAQQDELAAAHEQAESDLRWLQEKIDGYQPLVVRADRLATVEVQIKALNEQRAQLTADIGVINAALYKLREDLSTCANNIAEKTEATLTVINQSVEVARVLRTLEAQAVSLRLLTAKAPLLAEARIRIDNLEAQLGDVSDQHETVYADLGDLNDKLSGMSEPTPVELKPYEEAVDLARAAVTLQTTKLALAEKELRDAETKERRRQELSSQLRGLEERASNWTLLGLHLGKDHLQREEIACAGERLTEITNDLLRTAGDTRHTVSIETEKMHSNKKQTIPTLDINVFDSEEQQPKESRRLSDAGKILVGEPFRFAMVILGCQRAGITSPTVFTDEATGVMDPVNSVRYIGMLRRFAEILDARVIFISQQPAIQELADSRITLDQGRITIS